MLVCMGIRLYLSRRCKVLAERDIAAITASKEGEGEYYKMFFTSM